jgi:hypothetical protein
MKLKPLVKDRRLLVAIYAITAILGLGIYLKTAEVATSIAIIALGIAGANAAEAFKKPTLPESAEPESDK